MFFHSYLIQRWELSCRLGFSFKHFPQDIFGRIFHRLPHALLEDIRLQQGPLEVDQVLRAVCPVVGPGVEVPRHVGGDHGGGVRPVGDPHLGGEEEGGEEEEGRGGGSIIIEGGRERKRGGGGR